MMLTIAFSWLLRLLFSFAAPVETDPTLLDTVAWQTKRLTWDDFKGRPDSRYAHSSSVALTSSGINIYYRGYESNPDIRVTCTFYRKRSWVKDEGRNRAVLQHEQLHFDITEFHARKLRYAIAKLSPSQRSWQTVQRRYNQANRDCDAYQTRYDRDTHHSIDTEAQKVWIDYVAEDLLRYESYASR